MQKWKFRPGYALPQEQRQLLVRLLATDLSVKDIAAAAGVHESTVRELRKRLGGVVRRDQGSVAPDSLTAAERVEIYVGLERGDSMRCIARKIARQPSTVSREIRRNGGREAYRPLAAHEASFVRARRPKPTKLSCNEQLRARVESDLQREWSPQQISHRLKADFPDDASMHITHETIYKSLFVQSRGELNRELTRCLRSGRTQRKRRGCVEKRGRIPDMLMISERPAEVEDRAIPGHWEGDLIIGKQGRSAVGTLVERRTRFVMLLHLPDGHGAEQVRTALQHKITQLPDAIKRSLTWDQGREMSQHATFTVETGIPVYFCDPHSPWQRGSNENTNGLLRQYMPKGTDLSVHTEADLDAIADRLNGRPRQTLGWMTPSESLDQELATAPHATTAPPPEEGPSLP